MFSEINNKELIYEIIERNEVGMLKKVSNVRINAVILHDNLITILNEYDSEEKTYVFNASVRLCKDIINELEQDVKFYNSLFEASYTYDIQMYNILIDIAETLSAISELIDNISEKKEIDLYSKVYKFINRPYILALSLELLDNECEYMMPSIFEIEQDYSEEYDEQQKKVMDFASEFNISKTTVFKKIKENNIKTEKIKNTSYVISNEDIDKLNELLKESPASEVADIEVNTNQTEHQDINKEQKDLKKILELDEDSYKYVEKLLLGKDTNQDIISEKDNEIERLKKQLAELQQKQTRTQEFDKLLAEKDIRIKALNEDKVNLNRQIEMGIESLQNQQLRENLTLTYKQEEKSTDVTEQKSTIKQENQPNDPAKNTQSNHMKQRGFFGRLFGK